MYVYMNQEARYNSFIFSTIEL